MKKLIKLLPVVLAMLMLFSFGAFAEETGEIPDGEQNITEVTLPEAPVGISIDASYIAEGGYAELLWDEVADVDGYNFYIKEKGNWVLKETFDSADSNFYLLYGLLYNSKYEIGLKSYITVDGVNYESEEMCTDVIVTPTALPRVSFWQGTYLVKDGIKVSWEKYDCISGYRLYVRKDGKWVKVKDIYGKDNNEYIYTDVVDGNNYYFAVKSFVKGTEGTKFSSLSSSYKVCYEDVTRVKGFSSTVTASSVTLKWDKVEDARGYRIFMYQGGKWKAIKTTTSTSYTVTGLEASKKYIFRVRAYEKVDGATVWFPYSKNYSTVTGSKTVDAYRIKNLEKSFSDGDWYVQIKNQDDGYGNKITMTFAGKGDDIFYRYQLGKQTIEYFYQASKDRLYIISDADKEYVIVPDDEAESFVESMFIMAEIVKVQNVGKVTAKTCVYNGYSAVQETYTDTVYGFNKTYYFVKDKVAGLTVELEGAKDEYKNFSVVDTPSSSLFKVPSGYKKVSWN